MAETGLGIRGNRSEWRFENSKIKLEFVFAQYGPEDSCQIDDDGCPWGDRSMRQRSAS